MSGKANSLESLFKPAKIAIIGASEQGLYPAGILQSLLDNQYPGEIYPVNPKRATVFGLPAYPDVTQTPSPPDLVVITIPRQLTLPAIQQCIQRGVKAAVIISSGFAEADEEGRRLQTELSRMIAGSGMRVVGPNCAGLANLPDRVIACRLPGLPRSGDISFISQSGALMMAFYGLFRDRKIGMNRLLSLGNQVDLSIEEAVACLVEDPLSRVITVFLEGISDGRVFIAAARRALLLGKPIIVLKSGRTQAGQRAAASHTAALSGSDRVFQAACRQYGVIVVDDLYDLVMTAEVFNYLRGKIHGRFQAALVTQSGGMGSLAADLCIQAGMTLQPLSPAVRQGLLSLPYLFHFGDFDNPVDVRAAGLRGPQTVQTLQPFLDDEQTDGLLLLLAKQLARAEDLETAEAMIFSAKSTSKPLMVVWMGPHKPEIDHPRLASDLLLEHGIPTFEQPGDCTRAIGRYLDYLHFRQSWLADPDNQDVDDEPGSITLPSVS